MKKPRFREVPGGGIVDMFTGRTILDVNVAELDTRSASRVVAAVIECLDQEFGPKGLGAPPANK